MDQSYISSIYISKRSLEWLTSSFHSLFKESYNHKFFRKLNDEGDTLWIEKHRNKNGYYVDLTLLEQSGHRTNIINPSMENKLGGFLSSHWSPTILTILIKITFQQSPPIQ